MQVHIGKGGKVKEGKSSLGKIAAQPKSVTPPNEVASKLYGTSQDRGVPLNHTAAHQQPKNVARKTVAPKKQMAETGKRRG